MTSDDTSQDLKIAVVCVTSSLRRVREAISLHVPDWEQRGEIKVVEVLDHWRGVPPEVARRINAAVPKAAGLVQIMVLDKLQFNSPIPSGDDDLRRIFRIPALDAFSKKLPAFLCGVGLDRLSSAERRLSRWRHGHVDKRRITLWLQQFDECGSNRWIGEGLLSSLAFWTDQNLIEAVDLTPEALSAYNHICLHRQQTGKSADVLANLFTKRIKPLVPKFGEIEDFRSVLSSPASDAEDSLLFLEDGLFSGTEMIKLISDLLGLELSFGRQRKAEPLSDRSLLSSRRIMLLFPVATSLGLARLSKFLHDQKLFNIEVRHCPSGFFDVLTPQGKEALDKDAFMDKQVRNCPSNPDSHFVRLAFESTSVWKTVDRRTRALEFCKQIGIQLFRHYLSSVGYKWDEIKIRRCALGMFGIGLAFAFTHSIPKSSLPLFWASGRVEFEGKTIDWVPLFPNS